MGIWGLDIYDDDLAVDLKEQFNEFLNEGMEVDEAIDEIIDANDDLLDNYEEMGTFVLTIASIAKENEVKNKRLISYLKKLEKSSEYWESLKEESEELYEARMELLRELV